MMNPWSSLAPFGKTLSMLGGDLFYYDSEGNNDSARSDDSAKDDSSANKPTVILIHGLGDEADTWRYVFPLLAGAGYRVIAPDLPGFGRSVWKGRISARGHCNAVIRLMTETGAASAERPAALAGSSLGAGIAEMIACRRPDLVKALILIDGCIPVAGKAEKGGLLISLPIVGKKWYRSFRKNHEAAWKSLYPYYGDLDAMSGEDRDFLRERVIARVESPNQERGYLSTIRSMNNFFAFGGQAVAKEIKNYAGKIAVIWGEKDNVFPLKKADLFRSLRPDAELTIIPGAGHLPHQEKPEASAAEMLRLLGTT